MEISMTFADALAMLQQWVTLFPDIPRNQPQKRSIRGLEQCQFAATNNWGQTRNDPFPPSVSPISCIITLTPGTSGMVCGWEPQISKNFESRTNTGLEKQIKHSDLKN